MNHQKKKIKEKKDEEYRIIFLYVCMLKEKRKNKYRRSNVSLLFSLVVDVLSRMISWRSDVFSIFSYADLG